MYKILGILNVVLLVVITAPYWIRQLNKHALHLKGPRYDKLSKS